MGAPEEGLEPPTR